MIYGVYAVRDSKTEFLTPNFDVNDQTAIRNFAFAINNAQNIMGFAPKDFDLYKVAEFDAKKGVFLLDKFPVPEYIISGSSVYGVGDYDKEA